MTDRLNINLVDFRKLVITNKRIAEALLAQTKGVEIVESAVISVDATGQGDVPITLDGEVITETNSASIKTAVELIDNAISGNEMLIAGGATQGTDVKVTLDGEVPEVQGDAAEDAAVSGNPVLSGGRYDASARSLDNGDVGALALYSDGALIIKDFAVEVALGNIPGYSKVNKFGKALDCDNNVNTDIWDGADGTTSTDVWVPPTQARTHTIASTDADDTDGGAGMRTVRIYGLTSWASGEVSEVVTLNTGSPPVTSNSYVIIHRMIGLTFGATESNEGIVTATATTDGTITAAIQAGEGQTQMVIYGIPSTQTLQIKKVRADVPKAGGVSGVSIDCKLLVKENADQSDAGFINKEQFFFSDTIPLNRHYDIPKSIIGPAIVKLQVNTDTNDTDVAGGFDAYIIDN
jgi:hypothetical protein